MTLLPFTTSYSGTQMRRRESRRRSLSQCAAAFSGHEIKREKKRDNDDGSSRQLKKKFTSMNGERGQLSLTHRDEKTSLT